MSTVSEEYFDENGEFNFDQWIEDESRYPEGFHEFVTADGDLYGSFEVFYAGERDVRDWNEQEEFGSEYEPGYYWWPCFPGAMPDGDPVGPFDSAEDALRDALEGELQLGRRGMIGKSRALKVSPIEIEGKAPEKYFDNGVFNVERWIDDELVYINASHYFVTADGELYGHYEVFYANEEVVEEWNRRYPGHDYVEGWYWWGCYAGLTPVGPFGPFDNGEDALRDAVESGLYR